MCDFRSYNRDYQIASCSSCTYTHTVTMSTANESNARKYFKAPEGCTLTITLITGYTDFQGNPDGNKDILYVYDGYVTGGGAAVREWYINHYTGTVDGIANYQVFTSNTLGGWVTLQFANNFSYGKSKFRLTVTCSCCTEPTVTGCPGSDLTVGDAVDLGISGGTMGGWSSSNSSVATVNSSGHIVAVGAGTVRITDTVTASGGYCAGTPYCDITVVEPPCTKISSPLTFSLSPTTGSVAAGGTTTATLTNGTGQTVAWSSDNTGVATVSAATSGSSITATITGVAEGTTNIKAKVTGWTSGGTTYCDTTVTYTVTVSDGCTQIGSSTSSTSAYSPLYGNDRYSYVQMLYTNAEVGSDACSITSIKFQYYTYGTSYPDRRVVSWTEKS